MITVDKFLEAPPTEIYFLTASGRTTSDAAIMRYVTYGKLGKYMIRRLGSSGGSRVTLGEIARWKESGEVWTKEEGLLARPNAARELLELIGEEV